MPNPKDVAARPTPRCRQRESGSVSWSSKLRGPASTPECRNPSDPGRYHDHSEPHIRFSSAAQDGPGSLARREDAKDNELPEPRSYEFCVDDLYNFREASQGAEIWTGSQDTSPAGWVDQTGADVKRNLLIEDSFFWRRRMSYSRSSTRPRRSVSLFGECLWRPSNN